MNTIITYIYPPPIELLWRRRKKHCTRHTLVWWNRKKNMTRFKSVERILVNGALWVQEWNNNTEQHFDARDDRKCERKQKYSDYIEIPLILISLAYAQECMQCMRLCSSPRTNIRKSHQKNGIVWLFRSRFRYFGIIEYTQHHVWLECNGDVKQQQQLNGKKNYWMFWR